MAIPNINDTYPVAPLENLFNLIGDAAEADIAALTPRSPNVLFKVNDLAGLAAITTEINGDLAYSAEGQFLLTSNGTVWKQATPATFASTAARDTAFAKASGAYLVAGARAQVANVAYSYNGTTWGPGIAAVHRQLDTTNSVAGMIPQVGTGRIAGTGATTLSENVTFPTSFAVGTIPHVIVSFAGTSAAGAFNPSTAGISAFVSAIGTNAVATGFTVQLSRSTPVLGTGDWYYSWVAWGDM